MRVALVRVNPGPSKYTSTFGLVPPPLGLASLAGAVRDFADVRIVDAEAERLSRSRLVERLEELDPDVIGVTVNASIYHDEAVEVARVAKRLGAFAIAGGHHATFAYPLLLKSGFDAVVLGEGERAFRELLLSLEERGRPPRAPGLAFLDAEGRMVAEPPALLENLDDLPLPAYDLLNRRLYRAGALSPSSSIALLESSRGCPYDCDFCDVSPFWGRRWRLKSSRRVIEELELVAGLGYNWVFFVDDNFVIPGRVKERLELLSVIAERGLDRLSYIVQLRADLAARHPELVDAMARAGVKVAFLGVESGDEGVLREMKKSSGVAQALEAVEALSKRGILVLGGFVIGAPYETVEAMKRTLKLVRRLIERGLDALQITIYTPLPGSKAFHEAAVKRALRTLKWRYYDCLHPVTRGGVSALRLLWISKFEPYKFYAVKWLLRKLERIPKFSKPAAEAAYRYMLRRLPSYLLGFLSLPLRVLREALPLLLERIGAEEERVLEEVLEAVRALRARSLRGVAAEAKILEQSHG
ncbi:MAG: radical SAM protein [Fervidicoccaceae archaeon]